jgi:UDP-N-acetylmuramate--alanine ligase
VFAKAQRVHFIGIGGIGMSGIAEILLNLHYPVSGSDLRRSAVTERLATLGATVFVGHAAANVVGASVAVISSAVHENNPEVIEARARKIPVIQRAEMLAELMRLKYGIAIAGMHGKTTTTSMVASVLTAGGLDPTVVVGGRVDAMGSNARLGQSQYLVAEADESDRSFLRLSPILAVVTNLDREHMDCYRDMTDVEGAFVEFMERVPFYGACVACADNVLLAEILPRVRRRVFTYGMSSHADYVLRLLPALQPKPGSPGTPALPMTEENAAGPRVCQTRFEVAAGGEVYGPLELNVPGVHNVLNATAAVAIGTQLEIAPEAIAAGLKSFRGVDRRFQVKGCVRGVTVVDDYGHHPTEIRATLRAAKECGYGGVHVIFQPHRYTRTRDLTEEFVHAFDDAASVEVLDIYAASEEPIAGITARTLVESIHCGDVEYAASTDEAIARAIRRAREGDAILTLGAGSVSQLALVVVERLGESTGRA